MTTYLPTQEDIAFCAALDWHCTPEQRAMMRRRADTVIAEPGAPPEFDQAIAWIVAQDDAGNSASYARLPRPYMFGATGYAGALAWLVDLIEFRRWEAERMKVAVAVWRECNPAS